MGARFVRHATIVCCTAVLAATHLAGAADPNGTHAEVEVIGRSEATRFGRLSTLCLTADGRLLAGDSKTKEIKVFSPEGEVVARWRPGFAPQAIHVHTDGVVYVAGHGKVAKLDAKGKVIKTVTAKDGGFPLSKASGITATDKDLFVSFGSGRSLGAKAVLVRFDLDLGNAKTIATGLRGCCRRLDLVAKDGVVYVAENARHRIVKYDRDGKVLATWGKRDRKKVEGFGSCCNPMNLCFGPDGSLYTAESGLGRIKRYKPDGTYLDLVGYADVTRFVRAGRLAASCSNIAIAVTKDAATVYVQDVKANVIRVLRRRKGAKPPTTRPAKTAKATQSPNAEKGPK